MCVCVCVKVANRFQSVFKGIHKHETFHFTAYKVTYKEVSDVLAITG